jgi:GNAT superfamily N-acetyltransferase
MNFVLYSHLVGMDIDAVIEEQIAHFLPLGQPFEWNVYDHDQPADLKERLEAHGFAPDDDPAAVMLLDVQEAAPVLLKPVSVEVRQLTSREQLDDVVRLEQQVWGGDFAWLKQRLGDHLEIPGYLSVYAAYVSGVPVCTGWVYFYLDRQFAGLFGGSTAPDYRGQGLYTALIAVRVQQAIRRGYRYLTTGASPMSRPILARHGFRFLGYACSLEFKRPEISA